ncbi:hypothetical protein IEE94_00135 [Yimella sp. cx-573]|nr:hypothetical protein [Yimella sp. cx-573]
MSWAGLAGSEVVASDSPAEGRRFGISVGRVMVGDEAPAETAKRDLAAALAAAPHDLLVVRWPAHQVALAATVAATGRIVLPADVLTYWEVDAQELATADLPQADSLRVDSGDNHQAAGREWVKAVVRSSFEEYGNHYSANPALDRQLALEGYLEWAVSSFEAQPQDALFLLDGSDPIGVATLSQDTGRGDLEVLLAGLVPGAQGRGAYSYLLRAVGVQALRRGLSRVIISTQAHNVRVQRAWVRSGLRPFAAVTTAHAIRPGSQTAQVVLGQRS